MTNVNCIDRSLPLGLKSVCNMNFIPIFLFLLNEIVNVSKLTLHFLGLLLVSASRLFIILLWKAEGIVIHLYIQCRQYNFQYNFLKASLR